MSKKLVLEALRGNVEQTTEDLVTGVVLGSVYIPNVIATLAPKGLDPYQIAGYLSALKADGLYVPEENGSHAGYFGEVVMQEIVAPK